MKNDGLNREMARWEDAHREEFAKERKKQFQTLSGIPIKRLYTPEDMEQIGFDYLRDMGFPGEYPYTRGMSATMFRGKLLSIQNYAGYATAQECNKLWKTLVKEGAYGVVMAYDLPTQLGYDPDHPRAEGEVGRTGVSLASLRDWEIACEGMDMSKMFIGQVQNALAVVGLASHLCIAEQQKVPWSAIQGYAQNDILKEYMARGNYIYPPAAGLRLVTDLIAFCNKNAPNYRSYVCPLHLSEKGANPVHETAFGLAIAFAYMEAGIARGLTVDDIAPNLTMHIACDHDGFFEEIAKLRAGRRVWARVVKEKYHAKKPQSLNPRWQLVQGGNTLHREQYLNNIARTSLSVLAGVLAGCDVYAPRPYDEQYGIPSQEAMITGNRCSQIVCNETGVTDYIDPLGGSYAVESLTSEMENRINEELQNIDKRGGVLKCVDDQYFQMTMTKDAYEWQKKFESGEVIRVGANAYRSEEADVRPVRVYRADPKVGEVRVQEMRELKKNRDNAKVAKSLEAIKDMARLPDTPENNIMPSVIDAVRCYATVGEIGDALREVWGEYRQAYKF
ncbi:MAG: methylmalonyl-CoA mutase [Chloroflexi bacterium]|nr:methylmalonyl-CoA mutase [Chloroflexota bacterium]